jgi:hypothetical protein
MPLVLISFTTVHAKWPKLEPEFVETLNSTIWSKTISF